MSLKHLVFGFWMASGCMPVASSKLDDTSSAPATTDSGDGGSAGNDADGDGVLPPTDCDDHDANVNPGIPEGDGANCDDGVDNDCDYVADENCLPPDPFDVTVDVYQWVGGSEDADTCNEGPCLDYACVGTVSYEQTLPIMVNQSWPVWLHWSSAEPVRIPMLGVETEEVEGDAVFNPSKSISVTFCHDTDCRETVGIVIQTFDTSEESCVEQTIDGFYEDDSNWEASNGEAYGVSNIDGEYCTSWLCTGSAPKPACVDGQPNPDECGPYGCECGVQPWSKIGDKEARYSPSVSQSDGPIVPFFADRWETGGLHAEDGSKVTFYQYSEVHVSVPDLYFRADVDVRTDWDGTDWDTFPDPDGSEGPPIFDNAINEFIAPADGFWPVEWKVELTRSEAVWTQPVWNVITRTDAAVSGHVDLRNLRFRACGSDVAEITCNSSGCTY